MLQPYHGTVPSAVFFVGGKQFILTMTLEAISAMLDSESEPRKKRMRILIVDNQVRARQSLLALLNAQQNIEEIREAVNGKQAIAVAEEFKPDLIVMDVRMPVLNGLEATKIVKQHWPASKIVLLSMYTEYESDALAAGADAFISKTDSPHKLIVTINDLMRRGAH